MTKSRILFNELSTTAYDRGDYTGWFEELYDRAQGDLDIVPWADCRVNPWLQTWVESTPFSWRDRSILVVGCGLGDDAEYLAELGAKVTAFDLSPTAIDWCRRRFPDSSVDYRVVDLFTAPDEWQRHFDLVIEIYTIQALPAQIRDRAIDRIGKFVAPNGKLLVVCRGRDNEDPVGNLPPFALTQSELNRFTDSGLIQVSSEDFIDRLEERAIRRFQVVYQRY